MALLMKLLAWIGPQTQGVPTSACKLMFSPVLLVNIMCGVFVHLCVMKLFSIKLMDLWSLLLIFGIVSQDVLCSVQCTCT